VFVAQREIKIVDRDSKITVVKPGEEVVGFESWDINARRAHLGLEWITEVGAGPKKLAPAQFKKSPPKPEEKKEQPSNVPDVAQNQCAKCARQFKSPKALKTHTTLAHK
jgi:hypothetical protein